jgi:mRNA-degrading endonuclease HigB of HigAB toxin-antitoxin module
MQVIARRTLRQFWQRHRQAEGPLGAWFAAASKVRWTPPNDVKRQFGATVDFVADNRIMLTMKMARKLYRDWGIAAEALIQPSPAARRSARAS